MPRSRSYDRAPGDIRPVKIEPGFVRTADGSALFSQSWNDETIAAQDATGETA
jgi:ribonuclease PH